MRPASRVNPVSWGLAALLLVSFLLKLRNLDHLALRGLDESFHVIVARNLIDDPLRPVLYRAPFLPAPIEDWQQQHVWMHKPPLALWQMAGSMALLGETPLAARLPSALLSTLAALLTFLIGVRLVGPIAGLVAAGAQAFHPVVWMQVHGYVFSDAIDVSLVFYTELGVWFVIRAAQRRSRLDAILAGVAMGLAHLTKSYLALIVLGVALVAAFAPRLLRLRAERNKLRPRFLSALILAAVATTLPWTLWAWSQFPRAFAYEHGHVLAHLTRDIESWAGPWDRIPFDYWVRMFHVLYVPALAGGVIATWDALRHRRLSRLLLLAWALGVLVPHLLATTKTPSATMIASPALFLLLGALVQDAVARRPLALGALLGSLVVASLLHPSKPPTSGMGIPDAPLTALRLNPWVLWHMLIAMLGGAAMSLFARRRTIPARVYATLLLLCVIPGGWLCWRWTKLAYAVTKINDNEPAHVQTGAWLRANTPENAVLLVDEREKLERMQAMFWSRRNAYALPAMGFESIARDIRSVGGEPLLISGNPDLPLPVLVRVEAERRSVYRLP